MTKHKCLKKQDKKQGGAIRSEHLFFCKHLILLYVFFLVIYIRPKLDTSQKIVKNFCLAHFYAVDIINKKKLDRNSLSTKVLFFILFQYVKGKN